MRWLPTLTALLAGALFGAGLLVSGMTNPQTVLDFLDVAGNWNPALAFTMGGAIAVAAPALWWTRRNGTLARAQGFIDLRLVGGAALFGIGWGMSGICPGPGLVILTGLSTQALVFVAAMALGLLVAGWRRPG